MQLPNNCLNHALTRKLSHTLHGVWKVPGNRQLHGILISGAYLATGSPCNLKGPEPLTKSLNQNKEQDIDSIQQLGIPDSKFIYYHTYLVPTCGSLNFINLCCFMIQNTYHRVGRLYKQGWPGHTHMQHKNLKNLAQVMF